MFKQLLSSFAVFIATIGFAFAQVDVNKADQAALDGIKGIGPKTSTAILDERKRGGDFKDWVDFESRVKGVGGKSATKLSQSGLTINGQAKPNASANASSQATKNTKPDAKIAKADTREAKKEVRKEEQKK